MTKRWITIFTNWQISNLMKKKSLLKYRENLQYETYDFWSFFLNKYTFNHFFHILIIIVDMFSILNGK